MKLMVASKLSPDYVDNMMKKFQKYYGARLYITCLTQLWQALPDVNEGQKNGASWLLSEKIELLTPNISNMSAIALYFISEKETSKQKYVVELVLKILDDTQEVAKINLTLLSEVTWCA
ncbi:MAG: hypothetical protein L0I48_04290 [Lactococcus plantarum]|nr:hypothetical protein [Lactococcus plantarum]MDN6070398.1 hypothetical protein [Lactococcus plantarum]MDN6084251.1 hypothetical protein [Lactococcus plantarum]